MTNRRSCFQITKVQEADSSSTDDAESHDDPDESQTEDADISRADLGVCNRSLSEGTLNSVGEHEEGQRASIGPANGGFSVESGGGGVPGPPASQPSISSSTPTVVNSVPASVAQANPVATSTMSTTTSNSRFRVIKIPFRRGRWTCSEFYGRDSEVSSRTDIKHAVTLDHNMDRDNCRLGVTDGSVVIPSAVSILQQSHGLASQMGSGANSLQSTGYSTAMSQHPQHTQVSIPQTHPSSLNDDGASLQKSQIIPPNQFVYSSQAGGHPDHQQQSFAPLQTQGLNTQNLPMASPSVGPPASQEHSPVITPLVPVTQGLGMMPQGGEGSPGGGPSVSYSSQKEDSRRRSDVLPQPSTGILSDMNSLITERLTEALNMVKNNLMYAFREEVLKEQIKELYKRNNELERENSLLKSRANTDQLSQVSNQISWQGPQQLYQHPSAPDNIPLVQHDGGMSASPLDYRQQHFPTLQPQVSNTQNLPMTSFSVGPPASQGPTPVVLVAQGGEAASVQMGSGASMSSVPPVPPSSAVTPATIPPTMHISVQHVTVPTSTTHTPPDVLGQTPSTGGLIQDQEASGGTPLGLSVTLSSQAEDSRQTYDFIPQPSADARSEKDGMKPFISESPCPPTPTVESKSHIPVDLEGEDESTSDASVGAIDNKIEQALDLVKNHLTYAVREEVEVLREKIKEQFQKNTVLEYENALLKGLSVGPTGSQSPVTTDVVSEAQGLDTVAQGRDAASTQSQVDSGASMDSVQPGIPPAATTTTHIDVQNVTATVPSTTDHPPGVLSQTQSTGGLAQGGAPVVLPDGFGGQMCDFLHQSSTDSLMEKDGLMPVILDSVDPPTPTDDSLFNIPIEEGSDVVAVDNKIEQALDLLKGHLMTAVQEEVEVLKEQIKEQNERNSVLEHENNVLKSLLNKDQLGQLSSLSAGPPASQEPSPVTTPTGSGAQGLGMEAQGGDTASVPPGVPPASAVSSSTTTNGGVQGMTATVLSTTNTPPGMLSQAPGAGGLVQAQGAYGGSPVGLPVDLSSQVEYNGQQKSNVLPQPSTDTSCQKDDMKPSKSESPGLPIPTVDSQLGLPIDIDGDEDSASVVAIYKKIGKAMDLVKSHLMYAVQEQMEVLKEQIKDQHERSSALETENAMLRSLANTDQLSQLSSQISPAENTSLPQQQLHHHPPHQDQTPPSTSPTPPPASPTPPPTSPTAQPTSPTSHRHDPNPPPH